jgi:hypothetical protein
MPDEDKFVLFSALLNDSGSYLVALPDGSGVMLVLSDDPPTKH